MAILKDFANDTIKRFFRVRYLILILLLISAPYIVEHGSWYFKTSVLPTQTPLAFDGTTLPVLKVPKWTSLTSGERNLTYEELDNLGKLIPIPVYDPNVLKQPVENLNWSSEKDLNIRNSKITFSVPYMGNYKLDGLEYSGSHLAVDIKIPMNTPIYSIGNGVIVKVSNQSSGFGKHIVIRHDNFPSLNNESIKETYYSSYSHLSFINVEENDVVSKGQFIGKSGATGTASTPHLHFQIDNSSAPWHPYWPFTNQDSVSAGLSFNESINQGLGKDKALKTTINPMLYVQKYMNGFDHSSYVDSYDDYVDNSNTNNSNNNSSTNNSNSNSSNNKPITDKPVDNFDLPPKENNNFVQEGDVPKDDKHQIIIRDEAKEFKVSHDEYFANGEVKNIKVTALNSSGDVVKDYSPDSAVYIDILLGSVESPTRIDPDDFDNGVAVFQITTKGNLPIQIKVDNGNISGQGSVMFNSLFSDVDNNNGSFKAISFLKENRVIGGYPDGSFKPSNVVSRVEALKFILNGINANLITAKKLPFDDTDASEWYSNYVATGYNRQIIEGYIDNSFRPANTVNRAEFVKMLLTAMEVPIDKNINEDVYVDVPASSWYAPYVKYAKDKNLLVIKNNKFYPEEGMTREETSELIYRTIMLKVSGAPKFSSGIRISDSDLKNYFS